ncbi:MAG: MBOAT family O-acyltransferase [Dysosmobacter sp.]
MDVYRGTIPPERNLGRFTLFMAFSPAAPGADSPLWGVWPIPDVPAGNCTTEAAEGATRFCFGLAKKVMLADALGQVADAAFSAGDQLTVALAWLGGIAYTLQLYFDFSGYTDMAIGLGRVFGFQLPENFNYPYISKSASEFWRRWHMTLFLLVPGLRVHPPGRQPLHPGTAGDQSPGGMDADGAVARLRLELCALGALLRRTADGGEIPLGPGAGKAAPGLVHHVYALVLIIVGWVLFRSTSLTQVGEMVSAMFGSAPGGLWSGEAAYYLRQFTWEWAVAILAAMPVKCALRPAGNPPGGRQTAAAVTLAWGSSCWLLHCWDGLWCGF